MSTSHKRGKYCRCLPGFVKKKSCSICLTSFNISRNCCERCSKNAKKMLSGIKFAALNKKNIKHTLNVYSLNVYSLQKRQKKPTCFLIHNILVSVYNDTLFVLYVQRTGFVSIMTVNILTDSIWAKRDRIPVEFSFTFIFTQIHTGNA